MASARTTCPPELKVLSLRGKERVAIGDTKSREGSNRSPGWMCRLWTDHKESEVKYFSLSLRCNGKPWRGLSNETECSYHMKK